MMCSSSCNCQLHVNSLSHGCLHTGLIRRWPGWCIYAIPLTIAYCFSYLHSIALVNLQASRPFPYSMAIHLLDRAWYLHRRVLRLRIESDLTDIVVLQPDHSDQPVKLLVSGAIYPNICCFLFIALWRSALALQRLGGRLGMKWWWQLGISRGDQGRCKHVATTPPFNRELMVE